jgi:hypothetical protein
LSAALLMMSGRVGAVVGIWLLRPAERHQPALASDQDVHDIIVALTCRRG